MDNQTVFAWLLGQEFMSRLQFITADFAECRAWQRMLRRNVDAYAGLADIRRIFQHAFFLMRHCGGAGSIAKRQSVLTLMVTR
jgi:hypothetical protein